MINVHGRFVSAWSPHYKKDRELIEKIQRRFTKMINNMDGKSYEKKITMFEVMDTRRETK